MSRKSKDFRLFVAQNVLKIESCHFRECTKMVTFFVLKMMPSQTAIADGFRVIEAILHSDACFPLAIWKLAAAALAICPARPLLCLRLPAPRAKFCSFRDIFPAALVDAIHLRSPHFRTFVRFYRVENPAPKGEVNYSSEESYGVVELNPKNAVDSCTNRSSGISPMFVMYSTD